MRSSRASKVALASIIGASMGGLAGSGVALANQHEVKGFINDMHMVWGVAWMKNVGNGMEEHRDVRVAESSPIPDTICNYNGQVSAVIPGMKGDQFIQRGNHHRGCSWMAAWKDYPNWAGNYPRGTGIRTKWISDSTPGGAWFEIGVLRD